MSLIYRLLALVLALGAFAGMAVYAGHEHAAAKQAQEALEDAKETIRRTQATLTLREDLRATTARRTASARASLQHATAAQPAWADAPVPQEVQDALCAHVRCAAAPGSVQHPASPASAP